MTDRDKEKLELKRLRQGKRQAEKQGCIVAPDGTFRAKFTEQKIKRLYGVSKSTLLKMQERTKRKHEQQSWDMAHHPKFVKKAFKQ